MRALDRSSEEPAHAKERTRENRSYCKAAFQSLHIAIGGDVRPCCEFRGRIGNVSKAPLGDIWTSAELRDLRLKMQRDERDDRCRMCYEMEDAGAQSLRQIINGDIAADGIDIAVGDSPKFLDIRFSNRCNLKCRTCGPDASSKWFADAQKLGWKMRQPGALIEAFPGMSAVEAMGPLLDTVEQINFAGGEPLIHEEQYALIEELIRRGRTDVGLSYISNMTELSFRGRNILSLWSHFKNVTLIASIDGHRQMGELVRDGISWDRFAKNVSTVRTSCPHVQMMFNITISIFNVHALPGLCQSLNDIEGAADVLYNFNLLQEPRQYSIQVLPATMKAEAQRILEAFVLTHKATPSLSRDALAEKVRSVVNYMNFQDGSDMIKRFRKDTRRLDELRGQDTAAVIPELASVLRPTFFEDRLRKARERTKTFLAGLTG